MVKDYVIYKGRRYNSGDTINILWYTCGYKNVHNYTGVFIDCDEEKDEYRFSVDGVTYCFNKVCFYQTIRNEPIADQTYNKSKRIEDLTFKDELNIDGMLNAWTWYIVIMLVSIVLNDRILAWIFATVVFFNYRSNKLKERGYK